MDINKIYQGNCLDILKTFEDCSVDCIVTSPPYFNLRDYGIEGQIGLEPTFDEYVNNLCDIFDEGLRVLKEDGSCWVVIGDTYNGDKRGKTDDKYSKETLEDQTKIRKTKQVSIGRKSLLQIPSRFAIEMCNRGWILRNEVIWHKPNAMPNSVKDRFNVDYEKLFFFTKNPMYYFNQPKEPMKTTDTSSPRGSKGVLGKVNSGRRVDANGGLDKELTRIKRSVWSISTKPLKEAHFATFPLDLIEIPVVAGCRENGLVLDPFMGAGTTAVSCILNDRNYIGVEINPEYIDIAKARIDKTLVSEYERLEKELKRCE